jgi:hypothetical protein
MSKDKKFKKIEASEGLIKFVIRGAVFILIPKGYGFNLGVSEDSLTIAPGERNALYISSHNLLMKKFEEIKEGDKK